MTVNTGTMSFQKCVHLLTNPNCPLSLSLSRGTADWFGVSKDSDTTQRWRRRSLQHCSHLYGGLKAQVMREMELHSQDNLSLASTETPPPLYLPPHHPSHHHYGMQRVGKQWGHVGGRRDAIYSIAFSCHSSFSLLLFFALFLLNLQRT